MSMAEDMPCDCLERVHRALLANVTMLGNSLPQVDDETIDALQKLAVVELCLNNIKEQVKEGLQARAALIEACALTLTAPTRQESLDEYEASEGVDTYEPSDAGQKALPEQQALPEPDPEIEGEWQEVSIDQVGAEP